MNLAIFINSIVIKRWHTKGTTTSETSCAELLLLPSKTGVPTGSKEDGKNFQEVIIAWLVPFQKTYQNSLLQPQEKKSSSDRLSPAMMKMSSTVSSVPNAACNMWEKQHLNSRTEQQPTDSVLTIRRPAPSVTTSTFLVTAWATWFSLHLKKF